ncbi:MAG TPA: hypothetical protein VKZ86_12275 [Cyclobacteriaceae bacterium]|nr:hypothetical protein [Cyclobacteriaceae bacterium]
MAHITVAEERYQFTPELKKKVYYLLGAGIVLFIVGLVLAMSGGGHDDAGGHAAVSASQEMVASLQDHASAPHAEAGEHHGSSLWLKRMWASLWTNNMYFVGIAIIGLFFVAIQYAAQAGWSAGILRIPLAMAQWLPIAGILTLVLWFLASGDLFHWTHSDLYVKDGASYDKIIDGKGPYFYWPLAVGTFPLFYLLRMVLFFGLWYWFFIQIRKNMLAEDLDPSTSYWFRNRSLSAWFLVFFAVSSSVAAWDWIMSIDTHWFSTMFGWYVFSSWWVTGLAFITLIVANLKTSGYLKIVNANHFHDLGKFIFAFSIFWTYIWFGQFLLIYYANIPEETVYFIERMTTSPYSWIFYANLILNFVLPFLLFMTRDSKRHLATLKLVCPLVLVGHWFDFYNMVTPAVMQEQGGIGFLEIGATLIFLAAFVLVMYSALARMPLIGRNHPMLEESLHHHI